MSPGAPNNSSGPPMGVAESVGRVRGPQVDQFTQVPQPFSQTPHSFSLNSSAANLAGAQSAPFFYQTMPADLRVPPSAPISQQASGPRAQSNLASGAAFDPSATHNPLGSLMASAAAHKQQQQDLLSQFSSLHGLSAVASAVQHQHGLDQRNQSKPQQFFLGAIAATCNLAAVSQQQFQTMGQPAARKPPGRRRRGARKCRKVYGMAQRPLWCTQCKWKKACSRFTAGAGAQPAEAASGGNFARRPKTREPPIDYQMAAAAAAAANGNHLIRNLLDMSASFQRFQAAVTQPTFRSDARV